MRNDGSHLTARGSLLPAHEETLKIPHDGNIAADVGSGQASGAQRAKLDGAAMLNESNL